MPEVFHISRSVMLHDAGAQEEPKLLIVMADQMRQ